MLSAKEVLTFDEIAQRVTADGRGGRATARQVELELKGNADEIQARRRQYIHIDSWVRPPSKPAVEAPEIATTWEGYLTTPDSWRKPGA